MQIFDLATGEKVPFTTKQAATAADSVKSPDGYTSLYWGGTENGQALLIDLGEERDLHGLVFYDDSADGSYLTKALFALAKPPPATFWRDYTQAHPDADAAPVKDFAVSVRPHVPPTPYRAYSKRCPPLVPPTPPVPSVPCTTVKVAQWIGAHGVAVTTTTIVQSVNDLPHPPGPGAPDDGPWRLRNWHMACL